MTCHKKEATTTTITAAKTTILTTRRQQQQRQRDWNYIFVFWSISHETYYLPTFTCFLEAVWPDWAIYWILDKFLKPLATINLPKSPTFVGNFYGYLATFFWSHCLEAIWIGWFVRWVLYGLGKNTFNWKCCYLPKWKLQLDGRSPNLRRLCTFVNLFSRNNRLLNVRLKKICSGDVYAKITHPRPLFPFPIRLFKQTA